MEAGYSSFQSRLAVSWISGYIGKSALVPITLHSYGAVAAGRLGITPDIYGSFVPCDGLDNDKGASLWNDGGSNETRRAQAKL